MGRHGHGWENISIRAIWRGSFFRGLFLGTALFEGHQSLGLRFFMHGQGIQGPGHILASVVTDCGQVFRRKSIEWLKRERIAMPVMGIRLAHDSISGVVARAGSTLPPYASYVRLAKPGRYVRAEARSEDPVLRRPVHQAFNRRFVSRGPRCRKHWPKVRASVAWLEPRRARVEDAVAPLLAQLAQNGTSPSRQPSPPSDAQDHSSRLRHDGHPRGPQPTYSTTVLGNLIVTTPLYAVITTGLNAGQGHQAALHLVQQRMMSRLILPYATLPRALPRAFPPSLRWGALRAGCRTWNRGQAYRL